MLVCAANTVEQDEFVIAGLSQCIVRISIDYRHPGVPRNVNSSILNVGTAL